MACSGAWPLRQPPCWADTLQRRRRQRRQRQARRRARRRWAAAAAWDATSSWLWMTLVCLPGGGEECAAALADPGVCACLHCCLPCLLQCCLYLPPLLQSCRRSLAPLAPNSLAHSLPFPLPLEPPQMPLRRPAPGRCSTSAGPGTPSICSASYPRCHSGANGGVDAAGWG